MQRNNIKIVYNKTYEKYQCISPQKVVLEEFDALQDAISWCEGIFDFICKK